MLHFCLVLLTSLVIASPAFSQDAQSFVEPCFNADGITPLDDLGSCTITVTDTFTGSIASQSFAASSPAGCSTVPYTVSAIFVDHLEGNFNLIGICQDTRGNVSVVSNTGAAGFPNVAPGPPVLQ